MDFYYPGKGVHGDLPPRLDFARKWHPRLLAQMPNVRLTILVGSYAQKYYLDRRAKQNLTATVADFNMYLPDYFPLVHPSPLNIGWRQHNPRKGALLRDELRAAAAAEDVTACVNQVGSVLTLFFTSAPVRDWNTAATCDKEAFATYFRTVLDAGFLIAPSQFEALFLSAAHTDEDVFALARAARAGLRAVAERM